MDFTCKASLFALVLCGFVISINSQSNNTTTAVPETTAAPTTTTTTTAKTTTETTTTTPKAPETTAAAKTTQTPEVPTTAASTTSTVAPPTPSPPSPAPSSGDEVKQKYLVVDKVNNKTCLMLTMRAHLAVVQSKAQTSVFNITSDFNVDQEASSCSKLTIISGSNKLALGFTTDKDNKTYALDNVDVSFGTVVASASGLDVGRATMKASYFCEAGFVAQLDHNVTLVASDVQFQAFEVAGADYATGTTCKSDLSPVIPIAVGAVLAALIFIVIVAYCVGRRKTRTGYEEI